MDNSAEIKRWEEIHRKTSPEHGPRGGPLESQWDTIDLHKKAKEKLRSLKEHQKPEWDNK